jgi:ABC-type spermidine/putrescine transport system permease subunit II
MANAVRRRRDQIDWPRLLLTFYIVLFFGFVTLPLVAVAIFSINDFPYYALPLRGLTLEWYRELLANSRFGPALRDSLVIAVATCLLATVLGTSFAFSVVRDRYSGKMASLIVGFLPLVTPLLVIGITFQLFFVLIGVPLSRLTVVVAHTTYAVPFVALTVIAALLTFDPTLEVVARDLGAGRWQTFSRVTLPVIWPAVRGGALIALLLSFNEFIIAFHTSAGFFTLPVLIYSMQRVGLRPDLLAYSTLLLVLVGGSLLLVRRLVTRFAAGTTGER